ncbi:hypothetical protein CVV38_01020 [Candidatus Peregrinibacteria bacterium HGW-Peregrinibacteria-1]|jgi:2-oxoglutarate ferredoxin oxidoreductase subunit alpha|nr:MAG: hypothetical protein CVV38_01020 [Candidatus Peregrinibacteria bacterium HGW-Peregrinibacteria-1]
MPNRVKIKIAGESGAGLLSAGKITIRALRNKGLYVVADREYPSLIKGGHSCFRINAGRGKVHGLCSGFDVLMTLDKTSVVAYFDEINDNGIWVMGYERLEGLEEYIKKAKERGIQIFHLPARRISTEQGGNFLMQNMVILGMLWKALGFEYKFIENEVREEFADKPKLLEIDLRCLAAGYEGSFDGVPFAKRDGVNFGEMTDEISGERMILDGNDALVHGAVAAKCGAYFAYPMSPSSSILTYMAERAKETGIIVKQCEDEITVANMALGAMFMGMRSLLATSGGGYDLMTETVSLAGMIETPLVAIIAQRPGPATGLPTWTGQGDFNLAVYSAHGEFSRVVLAVSNAEDCYLMVQHALNLAEEFQIPVILLTEKQIAESLWTIDGFGEDPEIRRGLVKGEELAGLSNSDRYKITENGLSKRWAPGSSDAYYFANGDEHGEDGSLTEEADLAGRMYEKRLKKMAIIEAALPEPEVFGGEGGADISFVGWGSSKNVMLDVIEECREIGVKVNYLHFGYVFPLKKAVLKKFLDENKNVHVIEGNYTGQFANFVEGEMKFEFRGRLLKWNGRSFFVEEVLDYVNENKM